MLLLCCCVQSLCDGGLPLYSCCYTVQSTIHPRCVAPWVRDTDLVRGPLGWGYGHAIPVTSQFFPFVAASNIPTLLRWTGHFGLECEFQNGHLVFLDTQMDADGRWVILVATLSAFVKTAKVPNCSHLRAKPYTDSAHTSVWANIILFVFWSGHCFGKDCNHVTVYL